MELDVEAGCGLEVFLGWDLMQFCRIADLQCESVRKDFFVFVFFLFDGWHSRHTLLVLPCLQRQGPRQCSFDRNTRFGGLYSREGCAINQQVDGSYFFFFFFFFFFLVVVVVLCLLHVPESRICIGSGEPNSPPPRPCMIRATTALAGWYPRSNQGHRWQPWWSF